MALHNELPIYRDAYLLMKLAVELTSNFRRDYKHTIGQKLRDECVEMGLLILRANTARGPAKVPHIEALLEGVELCHLMLRLSVDMKLISRAQYSAAVISIRNSTG